MLRTSNAFIAIAVTIITALAFLSSISTATAQTAQAGYGLALSNTKPLTGEAITITASSTNNVQLVIISGNTTFRYLNPIPTANIFRPTAPGTYYASLVNASNTSDVLANTSFEAVSEYGRILLDKKSYRKGETVRISTYPDLPTYSITITFNNTAYRLLGESGGQIQFIPNEEGTYIVRVDYQNDSTTINASANFTVAPKQELHKLSYNTTYQLGDTVNITTAGKISGLGLLIRAPYGRYHFLNFGEGLKFVPKEAGNYTIELLNGSETEDTTTVEIRAKQQQPTVQFETFPLPKDVRLLLNYSSLASEQASFMDRLLGRTALTQVTVFVEGHEADPRFKLALVALGREVFELRLYSNPEIPPGKYAIIAQAYFSQKAISHTYEILWQETKEAANETGQENAATQPYNNSITLPVTQRVEFYFNLNSPATFRLNLTDKLPIQRSLMDNLLKRSRLDTLTLYAEGQESNARIAPKAERIANDDFLITIPWQEGIVPGVYKLVATASAGGNSYTTETLFSWGTQPQPTLPQQPEAPPKPEQIFRIQSDSNISYTVSFTNKSENGSSTITGDLSINFTSAPIKLSQLQLTNVSFKEGVVAIATGSVRAPKHANQAYAIDPSFFTFDKASIKATASGSGSELYACQGYNFSNKTCESWQRYKNLSPEEEYTVNFTAPVAIAEITPEPVPPLTTQTQTPTLLVFREQETRVLPASQTKVEILLTQQAGETITDAVLTENIPTGWSFASMPKNATAISTTTFTLPISLNPESKFLKLNYTALSPATEGAANFTATLNTSALASLNATNLQYQTEVLVDAKNTPFTVSTKIYVNDGQELPPRLATNITYTLAFSVKRLPGTADPKEPVIFTWPYNASQLVVEGIGSGCSSARTIPHNEIQAIECSWDSFSSGETRSFAATIKPLAKAAHSTQVNVTYDPPGVKATVVKKAEYKVHFTTKKYDQGLIIEVWHAENKTLPISASKEAKAIFSKEKISKNEKASILIENYNGEYFTVTVGGATIAFGNPPKEATPPAARETENKQLPSSNFISTTGYVVKKAGKATTTATKKIFSGITGAAKKVFRFLKSALSGGITGAAVTDISKIKGQPPATTQEAAQQASPAPTPQPQPPKKATEPGQPTPAAAEQPKETPPPEPELPKEEPVKKPETIIIRLPRNLPETQPPAQPQPVPAPAPKEWHPTYKTFTLLLDDFAPAINETALFTRKINCTDCDDYSVQPNTEANITIKAYNFKSPTSANLTEYYPNSWTVTDSSQGNITAHNQTHNKIAWQTSQSQGQAASQIQKSYKIQSPAQANDAFSFHSELEVPGNKAAEAEHKVLIKPFTLQIKTPSNQNVSAKATITKINKETDRNITVNLELKFSSASAKISRITFSNITIEKNGTLDIGYDDVPETKTEFAGKSFVKVFAIDPSSATFETATLTATAKGSRLLKCKDWNFSSQACSGQWISLLNLTPGQPYDITLSSTDPAWAEQGLVLINTHKSTYSPGEFAKIGIGILDNSGHIVCNASITLAITSPSGNRTVLSTDNGTIAASSQCQSLAVTYEPDYAANYTANEPGSHQINLTAATSNGTAAMIKNFTATATAQTSPSFVAERAGPTRINPSATYGFNLSIAANENLTGNITETVPANFTITNTDAIVIANDNTKLLVWNATLTQGSTYNLSYTFTAPDASPLRYELGPIRIGSFEEPQAWQLASDTPASAENVTTNPVIITKKAHFKLGENAELEFNYINDTVENELAKKGIVLRKGTGEKKQKEFANAEETVRVKLRDSQGRESTAIPLIQELRKGKFSVSIPSTREIRPGVYTLDVELTRNNETFVQSQSFAWGLISLNTNKSTYKPGQHAELITVVLDQYGRAVSNANITLTITAPGNSTTLLTSANSDITETEDRGVYTATFVPQLEGNYSVIASTIVDERPVDFSTYFLTLSSYKYDIIRSTKSKIDPTRQPIESVVISIEDLQPASATTPNTITIKEFVPAVFGITAPDAAVTTVNDTTTIVWTKELTANKASINYTYSVPMLWPRLYTLGPVEIAYGSSSTFAEARPWYVAVDPNGGKVQLKTVEYFILQNWNQTTATSAVSPFRNWSLINVYIPEINVVLKSAWVDLYFGKSGAATLAGGHSGLSINGTHTWAFGQGGADTGEYLLMNYLANVTSRLAALGFNTGPNNYNFSFNLTLSAVGGVISAPSAKLYLTYEYDDVSQEQLQTVRRFVGQDNNSILIKNAAGSPKSINFTLPNASIGLPQSAVMRDAWVEVYGVVGADTTTDTRINVTMDNLPMGNANRDLIDMAGGGPASFRLLYEPSTFDPNLPHTLNISISGGANTLTGLGAELVMTYSFDTTLDNGRLETIRYIIEQDGSSLAVAGEKLGKAALISLPQDNVAVQDAYVVVTGHLGTQTAAGAASRRINISVSMPGVNNDAARQGVVLRHAAADANQNIMSFRLLYNASTLVGLASGNSVNCTVGANASGLSSPGCELIVTFNYSYKNSATLAKTVGFFAGSSGAPAGFTGPLTAAAVNLTMNVSIDYPSDEGTITILSPYFWTTNPNAGTSAALSIFMRNLSNSSSANQTLVINNPDNEQFFAWGNYNATNLINTTLKSFRLNLGSPTASTYNAWAWVTYSYSTPPFARLIDNSLNANVSTMSEQDYVNITGNYSNIGNVGSAWNLTLNYTDTTGAAKPILRTCGVGKAFQVTDVVTACETGAGSCAEAGSSGSVVANITGKRNFMNITWILRACTGAATNSPYIITTNSTNLTDNSALNFSSFTKSVNITVTGPVTNCRNLNSAGTTYTLGNNVVATNTCFNITADSVTLDCNGFTVEYSNFSSGYGVNITGVNSSTVKNCFFTKQNASVQFNSSGIYAAYSNNSIFLNNTINSTGNYSYGIDLRYSNFTNISNNRINTSGNFSWAVGLSLSGLNNITANNITTSGGRDAYGINLTTSLYNDVRGNNVTTNGTGFAGGASNAWGIYLTVSNNNTIANNTVTTKGSSDSNYGIYLFTTASGNTVSDNTIITNGTSNNYGIILQSTANNNTVSNNTISTGGSSNNNYGIYLTTTVSGNVVSGNNVNTSGTTNNVGIVLETSANNNSVSNNTVRARGSSFNNNGIYLTSTVSGNIVSGNTVSTNGVSFNYGIYLITSANNNTVSNNTVSTGNGNGGSNKGIYLFNAVSGNVVSGNTITTNGSSTNFGISLESSANNNTVSNNTVSTGNGNVASNYGIYIATKSSGNIIIGNTINTSGTSLSHGIRLEDSANNNTIASNTINTSATESHGIHIITSNGSVIANNTVRTGGTVSFGVQIGDGNPSNNTIYNNIFNTTARHVNISQNMSRNNFSITTYSATNIVGGSTIGGNYYDNSTVGGRAAYSSTCLDANADGICDTLLNHSNEGTNNTDFYPLATVDSTSPNISIVIPLQNANVSGSFLINASVNDSRSNVLVLNLTIYNSTGNMTLPIAMNISSGTLDSGYWNATFDSTTLRDAVYNLSINATDNATARNSNRSANVSITIDNTKANVSIVVPFNNTNTSSTALLINASVNDSLTGVFNATFRLTTSSGSTLTSWLYATNNTIRSLTQNYWNTTFDTSTVAGGTYNITINATDYANNQQIINISTINIDATRPNATIVAPINTSNISGFVMINASVNDSLTGVFNVTFMLVNNTQNATVWLNATLGQGSISQGYWNITFDSTTVRDAIYNITLNATDFAGNQLIINSSIITIDNTKPNVSIVVPVNNTNTSSTALLINASVNDSLTGVFNATFRLTTSSGSTLTAWLYATNNTIRSLTQNYWNATFDTSTVADGTYNITINATDYANNQQILNISMINIQSSNANATIIAPANFTNVSGFVMINASVNASPAGVFNVTFKLVNNTGNATAWLNATLGQGTISQGYWNITFDSTTVRDAIYNITINATTFSGGQLVINSSIITIDNTKPNVSIVVPFNNTNTSSTALLINASVNDSLTGVFNATFRLTTSSGSTLTAWLYATNNTIRSLTQNYWNATFDTSTVPGGTYNITINATDYANNQQIVNISTINIDATRPNGTIVAPINTTNVSGFVMINASVNDSPSGVFNVTFMLVNNTQNATAWLNATLGQGSISQGYWNITFDSTTIRDATYNITLNATDFAGNQLVINSSTITIDNTKPNVSIVVPVNNTNTSSTALLINASVNDSLTGVFNATFRLTTSSGSTLTAWLYASNNTLRSNLNQGYWNTTFDTSTVPGGTYNITINATDYANNQQIINLSTINILVKECQNLDTASKTYTLGANIVTTGTCFNITADSVTLDCNGFTVEYSNFSSGYGVNITGVNSSTVKNCFFTKQNASVQFNSSGIYAAYSNNSIFLNNTINSTGNYSYGIDLRYSNFTNISNNRINTSGNFSWAVGLGLSWLNNITANNLSTGGGQNAYGINLTSSSFNDIRWNNVTTNGTGFAGGASNAWGIYLTVSNNNTIANNTVSTKGSADSNYGIYLFSTVSGNVVSGNTVTTNGTRVNYGIILQNTADNNTVANNTVSTGGSADSNYGIYLFSTASGNVVSGNIISTNGTSVNYGIYLFSTVNNNTVANNTIRMSGSANQNYGIYLNNFVSGNVVSGNTVTTNGTNNNYGIILDTTVNNNTVANNTVTTGGSGGTNIGIYLVSTVSGNVVSGNTVTTNGTNSNYGILLFSIAENNSVSNNTVTTGGSAGSNYGIYLSTFISGNVVSGNTVTTNGTSNNYGILLFSIAENNSVSNNTVTTGGSAGSNYGIYINNDVSGNVVSGNTVSTNGTNDNIGIVLEDTANNNTVSNNTISTRGTAGANYGIYLTTTVSGNVVSGNTVNTNGTNDNIGIRLAVIANNNSVSNNTITTGGSGASNYGIYLFSTVSGNVVSGNTVNTSGTSLSHGIRLEDSANNNTIAGNTINTSATESHGIHIITSNGSVIANNTVRTTGTVSFGVQIGDGNPSNNTIYNNIFNTTARHVNVTDNRSVNNFSITTYSATNIVGGSTIGGNYYDNSTVGGLAAYSSTCLDANANGICDTLLNHSNEGTNNTDFYPLATVDSTSPNISIVIPLQNANISGSFLINASANDSRSNVLVLNLTIYNSTGNMTLPIAMNISSGTLNSGYWNATFDSTTLRDAVYNLSINATDNATARNSNRSANVSITIDNTKANVSAISPVNGSVSGVITINASVNDSLSKVFNVTYRLTDWPGTVVTSWLNVTRGVGTIDQGYWNTTFDTAIVANGDYNITINATDFAGNQQIINMSQVTISNAGGAAQPDLTLNNTDIVFSTTTPVEDQSISINATIRNIGTANVTTNFTVLMLEYADGPQIGNATLNMTLTNLTSVNFTWIAKVGTYNVTVLLDTPIATNGVVAESNETNNIANNTIVIPMWNFFYGNITADILLSDAKNRSLFKWTGPTNYSKNIYVADSDSNIKWTSLQALGLNSSANLTLGNLSMIDFTLLDQALNTTNFSDSVNSTYLRNVQNDVRRNVTAFTIFGNQTFNVTVVPSINTTNFSTGILWDTSDVSSGNYYNVSDVVFVTQVNATIGGTYGNYNYEIRVPAALKRYIQPNSDNTVTFYTEVN